MTMPEPLPAPVALARGRAGPVFAGEVRLENVVYDTRGKRIIDDVTLAVGAGRIACLLGPSGCGKTTLLRLAAGIIRPTSGRILLDNFEVAGSTRFVPPERRNIGLVFQDFALFPHLTALQNVAYGLTALDRAEAQRVAGLALERVSLGHAKDRMPASLSGGEQQRVALARALVPRPQVILLDEPFSGLDQRLKDSVREDTLALLRETRATAIMVTHDPEEALAFADDIHVMQQGRIAQSGSPETLLHKPVSAAVARFFRHYNVFSGEVRKGAVDTPLGRLAAPFCTEGDRVDVMVAPMAIEVRDANGGISATIIENRDLGRLRRIQARLHATGEQVLILSSYEGTGDVSLALTGRDTHIFKC